MAVQLGELCEDYGVNRQSVGVAALSKRKDDWLKRQQRLHVSDVAESFSLRSEEGHSLIRAIQVGGRKSASSSRDRCKRFFQVLRKFQGISEESYRRNKITIRNKLRDQIKTQSHASAKNHSASKGTNSPEVVVLQ